MNLDVLAGMFSYSQRLKTFSPVGFLTLSWKVLNARAVQPRRLPLRLSVLDGRHPVASGIDVMQRAAVAAWAREYF